MAQWILRHERGFRWIGADFWPVPLGKGNRLRLLLDYYPYDRRTNLGIAHSIKAMLVPGREGPIATVRLELARENLQEVEARVFLERALNDPPLRAKLGDDLAARCQALLDERLNGLLWGVHGQWELALCADPARLSKALYGLAAEAAGKLP